MRAKKIILALVALVACMCIVCTSCSGGGGGGSGSSSSGLDGAWISNTNLFGYYMCAYFKGDIAYEATSTDGKTVYYSSKDSTSSHKYTKEGNTIKLDDGSEATINGEEMNWHGIIFKYSRNATVVDESK